MALNTVQQAKAEQIAVDMISRLERTFNDVDLRDFAEAMSIVAELVADRHQAAKEEAGE